MREIRKLCSLIAFLYLKTISEASFDQNPTIKFSDAKMEVKSTNKKNNLNPDCV
jgi:hypothetical protein